MKLSTFLFITTLASYTLASSTSNDHISRAVAPGCSVTNSSNIGINFQTQYGGLVAVGQATDTGFSGVTLSVTISDSSNALVLQNSQFTNSAGFNITWNFGHAFSSNVTSLSLLINNANTTVISVNHGPVQARPAGALPFPAGPQNVTSALSGLSNQIQSVLKTCQGTNTTSLTRSLYGLLEPRTTYGVAPKYDDTTRISSCVDCLAEVGAAAIACGAACAGSIGIACGCVAGIPLLVAQCHNPGTGLGQGCCPVGCGNGEQVLGIQVVFTCCFAGESCVNPTAGTCCGDGLTACGGNTCCPSSAPCRDGGICCPTTQNTCVTSKGQVCCDPGQQCADGTCCPEDQIFNGKCCPNCCTGSPPSECVSGGIEKCVNNQWVFSTCPYPTSCVTIPVAGAGAACQGSPFCTNGQPSYCSGDGYESCVNGRWAYTACKPPATCIPIPIQGAGVSCSAAP